MQLPQRQKEKQTVQIGLFVRASVIAVSECASRTFVSTGTTFQLQRKEQNKQNETCCCFIGA